MKHLSSVPRTRLSRLGENGTLAAKTEERAETRLSLTEALPQETRFTALARVRRAVIVVQLRYAFFATFVAFFAFFAATAVFGATAVPPLAPP